MKQSIIAFVVLLSVHGHAQEAEINLTEFLKAPSHTSPDLEKLAKLKIPFRQNNLYGLCSYDFEVVLEPQFEDIEAPDPKLSFFKAKKNGKWSFYDLSGKKVLPIEVLDKYRIEHNIKFIGDDVSKRRNLDLYISQIKDPISYSFTFSNPTTPTAELYRYYYISSNTKTPIRAWYKPDYKGLFDRTKYYNTKFTNTFQYGYIKVMDENQKFTLLDQDGNALFEPVLNCTAISPTKVLLLNKYGKCAIMDVNQEWITDYRFTDVKKTVNPNLLIGQESEIGTKTNYYLIDSLGKLTLLSSLEDYVPINNEFSRIKSSTPVGNNSFILYNEKTAQKERDLPNYELNYTFNEIGFSIQQNNKIIGMETLKGDTILSPDYESFSFINDSTYFFKQADRQGLANTKGDVLYEISDAQLTYYSPDYFKIKANKNQGLVRTDGKEIFPPIYNLLFHQPDVDRVIARIDNTYGYYEWSTGRELMPIKLNYLANTYLPYQSGACVELKVNGDRYIVNSNLEIRYQSAKAPIVDRSHFRISDATKEIQEDFEKSRLPKAFPNYVIFNGQNMAHIFQCDGTYITSLKGFKYFKQNYQRTADVPMTFGESIINYGIAQFKGAQSASFWVRLEDGMIYHKE
jgi:hypothetical protein